MYAQQPIYPDSATVELPDCMYKMKNLHDSESVSWEVDFIFSLSVFISLLTSVTRAEMHLFPIICINLYGRNGIKVNALASRDVIVLTVIIIPIFTFGYN